MRIPFTLDAWLKDKSQKVETKDGRPSRILCWDRRGERTLVVLVQQPLGYDDVLFYYESGLADGFGRESDEDLFLITPEPEMTKFEKAVDAIYESCGVKELQVKKKASELLSIAKQQLLQSGELLTQEHHEKLMETLREERTKDLPRWGKWRYGALGNGRGIPVAIVKRGLNGYELVNSLGVPGERYIMLSDLEKLPGFKEDENHE